jgi:hypothetical protein
MADRRSEFDSTVPTGAMMDCFLLFGAVAAPLHCSAVAELCREGLKVKNAE